MKKTEKFSNVLCYDKDRCLCPQLSFSKKMIVLTYLPTQTWIGFKSDTRLKDVVIRLPIPDQCGLAHLGIFPVFPKLSHFFAITIVVMKKLDYFLAFEIWFSKVLIGYYQPLRYYWIANTTSLYRCTGVFYTNQQSLISLWARST